MGIAKIIVADEGVIKAEFVDDDAGTGCHVASTGADAQRQCAAVHIFNTKMDVKADITGRELATDIIATFEYCITLVRALLL